MAHVADWPWESHNGLEVGLENLMVVVPPGVGGYPPVVGWGRFRIGSAVRDAEDKDGVTFGEYLAGAGTAARAVSVPR